MIKRVIFIFAFICLSNSIYAQKKAYDAGEWFKYRIHYGWFNASYATLEVKNETLNNVPVYHVVGKGKSTGLLDIFFNVDDNYETYIEKSTGLPLKFVRKIDEGGHKKDRFIEFDQNSNKATVHDLKHSKVEMHETKPNVQDLLSVLYFLRNKIDPETIAKGDELNINMFFDNDNYKFKTVFLGRETIKTKFGKVKCLKFRPYVQAGRVFKEEESLTFWISDDANKIPIKIKAKLSVGSLEADLDAFKGLQHFFAVRK